MSNGIDQEDSWATKTRIRGIQGQQWGGPEGFRGDNVVDQGDQVHTSMDRMDKGPRLCGPGGEDPSKHRPEKEGLEEARTRRAKIQASTDLNSRGPRKRGSGGQRAAQARAGRIKVWVRENQSATKVSRCTGESNRGGQVESRGPPEANTGERKQGMMRPLSQAARMGIGISLVRIRSEIHFDDRVGRVRWRCLLRSLLTLWFVAPAI